MTDEHLVHTERKKNYLSWNNYEVIVTNIICGEQVRTKYFLPSSNGVRKRHKKYDFALNQLLSKTKKAFKILIFLSFFIKK